MRRTGQRERAHYEEEEEEKDEEDEADVYERSRNVCKRICRGRKVNVCV
jgi:hypothetical protein